MNEREFTLRAVVAFRRTCPDDDAWQLADKLTAEARKRGLFGPAEVPFPREMTFTASDTIHNNHAMALAELEAERLRHRVTERVLLEDIDRLRAELDHNITRRPAPKRRVKGWVNVNMRPDGAVYGSIYMTKEIADKHAAEHRIACIEIDCEEGEGL